VPPTSNKFKYRGVITVPRDPTSSRLILVAEALFLAKQQAHEEGAAEQGGQDTDGELRRCHEGSRWDVADHQETGTAEGAGEQQLTVGGADDETHAPVGGATRFEQFEI